MGRSGTLCVMGACARPKRGCMLRCGPRRLSSTPMSSSDAPASTSSPLMRQLGAAPPVFRDMPMPGSGAARNETGWTFYPSCKVADGWMVEADGRGEVALVRVVRSQVGCGRCHFHSSLQPAACTQREQHSFSASREQQPPDAPREITPLQNLGAAAAFAIITAIRLLGKLSHHLIPATERECIEPTCKDSLTLYN